MWRISVKKIGRTRRSVSTLHDRGQCICDKVPELWGCERLHVRQVVWRVRQDRNDNLGDFCAVTDSDRCCLSNKRVFSVADAASCICLLSGIRYRAALVGESDSQMRGCLFQGALLLIGVGPVIVFEGLCVAHFERKEK